MVTTVSNLILIQTLKKRSPVEFRLGLVPILWELVWSKQKNAAQVALYNTPQTVQAMVVRQLHVASRRRTLVVISIEQNHPNNSFFYIWIQKGLNASILQLLHWVLIYTTNTQLYSGLSSNRSHALFL